MLSPYRALDLTDVKGFFCGKVLGDLGANVIKIEPPCGDPSRNIGPFYHDIPDPERSLLWFAYNTSKRGITLNLETADGQDIFKQMIKTADFVIESFKPGYLANLGLGYPELSKINPRIIMTSISPFGQTGPYWDYKTSDLVATAVGGLLFICGDTDRAPLRCTAEQSFPQAGVQAAMGTILAHYHRELTGEGQHVDVSIQECIIPLSFYAQQKWDTFKANFRRLGQWLDRGTPEKPRNLQNVFPCKDGFISWQVMTGDIGRRTRYLVEWMAEEGMAGNLLETQWEKIDMDELKPEELASWEQTIGKFFHTHTKEELYRESMKRGVILYPCADVEDILKNEQLAARGFWIDVKHPELKASITYPGAPFKLSEPLWRISRRAPLIGEHNEEIYVKEMGFSKEKLAILKQANII
jgi:crotonobetainyl-CoA:carnitine CoA-transferase CaiB-like acyl-CoA transferase